MLLIDDKNHLHINEEARETLKKIWNSNKEAKHENINPSNSSRFI
jgi:hypothetical protein